ncbi:multicilin [Apteryx mantelli]|uniref:Multicilin n=1 Tax=Apteryx mantelli TaxID=2696672 RepID=A0ABM4G5Q8_9AVES
MQQGGRRAFGSICPNTVQDLPSRLAKKPGRLGGAPPGGGGGGGGAGYCSQDELDFDFQEFRDAVDDFISDSSTLMPLPLDSADFDFSLGEDVAFSPCALQLESSALPQLESSALPQLALQSLPSPELHWRDVVDQHEKALGDALEENSQLQETLMQRQEELTSLRERNVQLKELASQARQLAAVLDVSAAGPSWLPHSSMAWPAPQGPPQGGAWGGCKLMQPQCPDGAALAPPAAPAAAAAAAAPAAAAGRGGAGAGVGTMLREVSRRCRAALRSLGGGAAPKRPRRAAGGGGGGCLRAALGEAGGIRTLAFPQGSAFSLRTAGGGYRFRWVPR